MIKYRPAERAQSCRDGVPWQVRAAYVKQRETVIYGRPLPGTRTSPDLHEIAFNGLAGGPTVSVKAPAWSVCLLRPGRPAPVATWSSISRHEILAAKGRFGGYV